MESGNNCGAFFRDVLMIFDDIVVIFRAYGVRRKKFWDIQDTEAVRGTKPICCGR